MIRYMVVRDLRQFSFIYLVFLYSFSQSIFFVNFLPQKVDQTRVEDNGLASIASEVDTKRVDDDDLSRLLADYSRLWMDLFKMTLGVYDLQPYRHSSLARIFFLLFIYLIPILFNM